MKVYLYRLDIKSSGLYRCEVTAEAPFFQSAQNESRMDVICKLFLIIILKANKKIIETVIYAIIQL